MKRLTPEVNSVCGDAFEDPDGDYVLFEEADQAVKNVLRIALCALAQYGNPQRVRCFEENNEMRFELDHLHMVAGQELFDVLETYGLAEDSGSRFHLTMAGVSLMEGLIPE